MDQKLSVLPDHAETAPLAVKSTFPKRSFFYRKSNRRHLHLTDGRDSGKRTHYLVATYPEGLAQPVAGILHQRLAPFLVRQSRDVGILLHPLPAGYGPHWPHLVVRVVPLICLWAFRRHYYLVRILPFPRCPTEGTRHAYERKKQDPHRLQGLG